MWYMSWNISKNALNYELKMKLFENKRKEEKEKGKEKGKEMEWMKKLMFSCFNEYSGHLTAYGTNKLGKLKYRVGSTGCAPSATPKPFRIPNSMATGGSKSKGWPQILTHKA